MSMMTSSRPRGDASGSLSARRGHTSQLSISDESHHVTETIGTLYGDEYDSPAENSRPLSFVGGSTQQEQIHRPSPSSRRDQHLPYDARKPLTRSMSDQPSTMGSLGREHGDRLNVTNSPTRSVSQRSGTFDHGSRSPVSPGLSLRDVQAEAANSQFPLTNIDNPTDIAQELSNLQALRRLSMDVGNSIDPDMPPMTLSAMPVIAPSGDDDENDPSRLLWVPARVHPELAPTEFKTFLEGRVQSIRRRSGDPSAAGDGSLSRSNSGASFGGSGSLSRRSSMLSRQIDNSGGRGAVGYVDGAERLERQKSQNNHHGRELSLDDLVKDPTTAVQKFAQESSGQIQSEGDGEDMPILPMVPGMGLRRSTRTTYRKGGSLRSGERGPVSRRATQRQRGENAAPADSSSPVDAPPGHGLTRVQSEPVSDNFSRPSRSVRRQQPFTQDATASSPSQDVPPQHSVDLRQTSPPAAYQDQLSVRSMSGSTSSYQGAPSESRSAAEEVSDSQDAQFSRPFPQRSSSQQMISHQEPVSETIQEPPARSNRRPATTAINHSTPPPVPPPPQQYTSRSHSAGPNQQMHSLNDALGSSPSPFPGGDASRTDNLTFIPTLTQDDKKQEKKSKKDRDDDSASSSSKSGSAWKWFKGSTDDKDKKKDESKKSKMKAAVEKAHDNVRLDVIQNSIDKTTPRGRESLVLERESMDNRLQEERKKESNRKSDSKREKDGNIFSSIFGGSKKKEEKDRSNRKTQHLQVPEEPPYKPLQPDVDYNWTRFPLLEERAIYRMAHIKLANPRRPLLSQVLLSNFMYSYLAIVQAMHPQMNVPVSPQQKRLEEEARRKQEEEYMAQQQMQEEDDADNSFDQYNFDYHRAAVQYAESGGGHVDYVDEAQIYEDEHGNDHANHSDQYDYDDGSEEYGSGMKDYYQYHDNGSDHRRDGESNMW